MRCGLIGKKLGHSHSKIIHEMLGIYGYDLLESEPEALSSLVADEKYSGFNVTIPYKLKVMPLCSQISEEAELIGCVNTLVRNADGSIHGYNTDFFGFKIMSAKAGIDFKGKKVLILGSGGTSKTASSVVKSEGAAEIVVISRSGDVTYSDLEKHRDAQVLINTTPVGMYPENASIPISLEPFTNLCGVLDVVYNPVKTRLIQQAEQMNIPCSGGLYMLAAQAVAAAELFTGESLLERVDEIFEKLRALVENIVIIGMPGSGKSSLGRIAAELMDREFLDTDTMIEAKSGMNIPDIFEKHGETHFRALECEVVSECGKRTGVVISTGGGVPMRLENRENLIQNGKIILICREIDNLARKGRPLSADMDALKRLEKERMPVYKDMADVVIDNKGSINDVAKKIVEAFI